MALTAHAERRAQQRGIPLGQIQLAVEYGCSVRGGYLLTAKDRNRAIADANAAEVQGDLTPEEARWRIDVARRSPDVFVGVKEGDVTTVFRPTRSQRRSRSSHSKTVPRARYQENGGINDQ